jgi:CheY-like chemotaxis protein
MTKKRKETILVVDDDKNVLVYIKEVLTPRGYRLILATSGEEAMQLTDSSNESINLLLTDVILPKMDGRQLAHKFLARYPLGKVLFISGYICPSMAHQNLPDSEKAFIRKPFTPAALAHKVENVLKSKFSSAPGGPRPTA